MTAPARSAEPAELLDALVVDVWSDLVCPWCWIGLTRLEKAIARLGDPVRIRHHAFRLMPGAPLQPALDVVLLKAGGMANALRMFEHVEGVAAGEGLTYHLAQGSVGDTTDAHRIIKLGQAEGLEVAVVKRLYRAVLTEHRSVFDPVSLVELAVEAGIDRGKAEAVLRGEVYKAEVEADERQVRALGGRGVPFFLIGGRSVVSGAQPGDVLLLELRNASTPRSDGAAEGPACDASGCAT